MTAQPKLEPNERQRERRGVELRGTPVPPRGIDVELFVRDFAAMIRRIVERK